MTGRFGRSMAPRVLLLAALALAISAAPAQAANATSFSGEATVVDVVVHNPAGGSPLLALVLGHAGPLPPSGGSDLDEILNANVNQAPLTLTASVIRARTEGAGSTALSVARASGLNLSLTNLVALTSTTLRSTATAICGADGATVVGESIIEGLVVNNTAVNVTGQPNQTLSIGPVDLVINEQIKNVAADGSSGAITVNALRITVNNLTDTAVLAEVVLSSAHADVTCPAGRIIAPDGAIGGPCADPAYYGIFDNTDSTVALVFRFRWYNGSGLNTVTKTVPAGAIYRTWEHWVKPSTIIRVGYRDPRTGTWINLASEEAVRGNYPPCVYKRGWEFPNA